MVVWTEVLCFELNIYIWHITLVMHNTRLEEIANAKELPLIDMSISLVSERLPHKHFTIIYHGQC